MKQGEETLLKFAGYVFIHRPEMASDLNTLMANYINSDALKNIESSSRIIGSAWLVQDGSTMINHGLFSTEEKALEYIGTNKSMAVVRVDIV